jgi:hypothetical protein
MPAAAESRLEIDAKARIGTSDSSMPTKMGRFQDGRIKVDTVNLAARDFSTAKC